MRTQRPASPFQLKKRFEQLLVFLTPLAGILWLYRFDSWSRSLPGIGDALEIVWAMEWLDGRLTALGGSPFFAPVVFAPLGWSLTASANGVIILFLASRLLQLGVNGFWLFNFLGAFSFVIGYSGMYRLMRRDLPRGWAVAAAFLFAFWSGFTVRAGNHLLILWGAQLLPWLLLGLEEGLDADRPAGRWGWSGLAALAWALALSGSLYFLWIGGVLWGCWLLARGIQRKRPWFRRKAWLTAAGTAGLTAVLALPTVFMIWRGLASTGASFYDFDHLRGWGISPDLLLLPSFQNPLLGGLTGRYFSGELAENRTLSLGPLTAALIVFSLIRRRDRPLRLWGLLLTAGVVIGLGPLLYWGDQPLRVAALQPLNNLLWSWGHALKPALFPTAAIPSLELAQAVPLPDYLLLLFVPWWEGARVAGRFAFLAALAAFPIIISFLARLRPRWLGVVLLALVMVEQIPGPLPSIPFPQPTHPAFTWLRENSFPETIVADLYVPLENRAALLGTGDVLWSTTIHGRSSASPASSVLPAHTDFLQRWLLGNKKGFQADDFPYILSRYRVEYLLLHQKNQLAEEYLKTVEGAAGFDLIDCFAPAGGIIWTKPICIVQVHWPAPLDDGGIIEGRLRGGWSGIEPWGVWAEQETAELQFVALEKKEHLLRLSLFPHCLEEMQTVEIALNGRPLERYTWQTCAPVDLVIPVPADQIQIDWNTVVLTFGHARSPAEVTGGENADPRLLAAGLTGFTVEETAP